MEEAINILVHSEELDEAIEKANRLVELLREASSIISSLSTDPADNREHLTDRIAETLQSQLSSAHIPE